MDTSSASTVRDTASARVDSRLTRARSFPDEASRARSAVITRSAPDVDRVEK